MNVVLKQELWRIWIMDSFQLTRVSPLCKKKNTVNIQIRGLTVLRSDQMKKTDPKCEDSILAEANSAAGAEAKNRFSGTECVLIQQLYNHGTWKIPGKHYEHRLVYGWMEARGVLTGQAGEDRYRGVGASLSSMCVVERSCL